MRLTSLPVMDRGFDACARDSFAAKPVRVRIAAVLALVCAPGLGWKVMALWFGAVALLEGFGGYSNRRNPYPEEATQARRILFVVQVLAANVLWQAPSVMMWLSGSPALQVAAVVQWLANLFYVQLYSAKSRAFALLSAAPQVAVVAGLVLFHSPFHGREAIAPTAILLMALANAGLGLAGAVRRHEILVDAMAERAASEQSALAARLEAENSERRFRMAAGLVNMNVWEVDLGTLQASDLIESLRRRVHPDDLPVVQAAWADCLAERRSFHMVHRMIDPPGWVESVADLILNEAGELVRLVCATRDIDAEKKAEEELVAARDAACAANQAKSEFLANMSHEIRTPLNGVMGVAGALARTELSADQHEMVALIETSGRTLETLLSDILDLARIEAGKMELKPEPFDLAGSVNACAALFDAAAQAKGLDLEVAIAPEALGAYVGDAARLRQVLANLLGNAVKFTTVGKVTLAVGARRGETSSELVFEVRDTGIGFDAETKARLFSRFEQADGSITRRFGGSGLGLSISRSLAEAMGGRLEADAAPDEGAVFTFTVELPRGEGALDLWDPAFEPAEPAADPLAGLRVLLAEDHPTNRRVVELILGAAGVDLTCVENGVEAVDAFRRGVFDLVLMDMQMPLLDGLGAIAEIRKLEAATGAARTPIHVLTANAMPEHVSASLAAGADGHLSKPILADALLQRVALAAEARHSTEPAGVEAVKSAS
jgi:signal transduction histidine kinase/CheY-like chemotaxis protein